MTTGIDTVRRGLLRFCLCVLVGKRLSPFGLRGTLHFGVSVLSDF